MKKSVFFLFICFLSLCACKTAKTSTEYNKETPINPHVPTTEISYESRIENTRKSLSTLLNLYNKMETWKETDPNFKKGIKKLEKVESLYSERITELASLNINDLSEEELTIISEDIRTIVSAIREVNDMFEFR